MANNNDEIERLRAQNADLQQQIVQLHEEMARLQSPASSSIPSKPTRSPQRRLASLGSLQPFWRGSPTRQALALPQISWRTLLALGAILLLAAYFRTVGLLTWDESFRLHPDERFYGDVASLVRIPASFGEYFDSTTSPLNPRNVERTFFVYGLFPITLTRLIAEQIGMTDYYLIYKVGRVISTLCDLGSIILVFLIGSRFHNRRVGLLAALLMALCVLPIQHAHFFTIDSFASFFALLALYWALRIGHGGRWFAHSALGISIGLAMAGGRLTLATLGLVGCVAALQYTLTRGERVPHLGAALWRVISRILPPLMLAGFLALLTFRTLQPDAFLGTRPESPRIEDAGPAFFQGLGFFDIRPDPRYLANMKEVQGMMNGANIPPSVQWVGRVPYLFPLQNMVLWGMGPALGILVCLGWAAAGWRILRQRWYAALPLWLWVTFYFAWQGGQFVTAMRYMLPIYGPLIVLAAWLVVDMSERRTEAVVLPVIDRRRLAQVLPQLGRISLVIVLVGSFTWAAGFTQIYTRPHSRITASQWLFNNLPPGATITSEHWDDALPLDIDGRDPWQRFHNIEMPVYAEDDPEKYFGKIDPATGAHQPGLLEQIDQADVIVLSSNRVYDSIRRMPMRFPALIRYYHALFSGELGFRLVADIHSYPSIAGIPIPDQGAEEAFSVYDHPRILIFQKTPDFSSKRAEQIITGGINWNEVYKISLVPASRAPTALRFTPSEWTWYQQHAAGTGVFRPGWLSQYLPALSWLLVLELIGAAAFGILFALFPMLSDRGYTLAKPVGLLLVSYCAWLVASLRIVPFGAPLVWSCTALLVLVGFAALWHQRTGLRAYLQARWRTMLGVEALFLAAFLALLLIRWLNPDLWHPDRSGEKPMDLAFLTAVVRTPSFPPYDPWFAGGYINYYYYGFVIVAVLVHLTGVVPAVGFNLAIPTIFALTAVGVWGLIYNLLAPSVRLGATPGRRRARRERIAAGTGVLAIILTLLAGNLAQAIWFLPGSASPEPGVPLWQSYAYQQQQRGRLEWAYWDATRLIEGTVNEFPFFTFLFADLHPHLIVMPFSLSVLILALALAHRRLHARPPLLTRLGLTVLAGLMAGALWAINTWDYLVFTGLMLLTLLVASWHQVQRQRPLWPAARAALLQSSAILALGALFFLPFTSHFATESNGVEFWTGSRTLLWDWVRINGLWLFVLLSAGAVIAHRRFRLSALVIGGLGALVAAVVVAGSLTTLGALRLLVPLLIICAAVAWAARRLALPRLLPIIWAVTALCISLACELIVVRGDVGRLNTVFKFGIHIWLLAGLASALALLELWHASRRWPQWGRAGWWSAMLLLLAAAMVYPLTATTARIAERAVPGPAATLDGLAYMTAAMTNELGQPVVIAEDAQAIDWIQHHVAGLPIIVEAHLPSYRWGGRIATATGLPTLLGWEWHEEQQRMAASAKPIIEARARAIEQIYASADPALTQDLLRTYGVSYIYFGDLERVVYGPQAGATFAQLRAAGVIEVVYYNGNTQIYRVHDAVPDGILTSTLGRDLTAALPAGPELSAVPQPEPTPLADVAAHIEQYRREGKLDDAIRLVRAELDTAPNDVQRWYLLGDLQSEARRYDQATAAYTQAIILQPNGESYTRLGRAQLAWGQLTNAEGTLKQAAVIEPNYPDSYYWLGLLFQQRGQHDAARLQLQHYLKLAPDGAHRIDADSLLQTLD